MAVAIVHHRSLRQVSRSRDDSRQAAAIGHRSSVIGYRSFPGLACFFAEPPLHIGGDIGGNAFGLFAAGTAEQIVGTAAKQTQPLDDTVPNCHQKIAVTKGIKVAAAIIHHRSLRQGSRSRDDFRQAATIGYRSSVIGHRSFPGLTCFLAEPPLHIGGNAFGLFAAGTAEQTVGTAAKQTQPLNDTVPCRRQNIAVTKRIKVAVAIIHHRSLRQVSRSRGDFRQAAAIGYRSSVIGHSPG